MNFTSTEGDIDEVLMLSPWQPTVTWEFDDYSDEEKEEASVASILDCAISTIEQDWDCESPTIPYSNYNGFSPVSSGFYGNTFILGIQHFSESDSDDDDAIDNAIDNAFEETIEDTINNAMSNNGPSSLVIDLEYSPAFYEKRVALGYAPSQIDK
jgi:hypothetical protein